MPRIRRLIRLRPDSLTVEQKLVLICGPGLVGGAFADSGAMRRAWESARVELIAEYGHGPWAFWTFHAREFPRDGESNLEALQRLGITPTDVDLRNREIRTRGTTNGTGTNRGTRQPA